MQINVMCVFRDFCNHVFGRSCQRQVLILSVNTCADNTIIIMRAGLCVLVVFAGLLSHQADQCHDCDAKAVDQHVRKSSCAARDAELVEFVGAGVEEDDGESREKTAFHVGGSVRKAESKPDGAVKYKIFGHMSGFSDGKAHELDEIGVLRRISVEKAELCAEYEDQTAHGVAHLCGLRRRLGGEPENGDGDTKRREPGKQLYGSGIILFMIHISFFRYRMHYSEISPFALALRSRIEWITGTMKIATIPPANPLLYKFMPPYTIPTFRATEE